MVSVLPSTLLAQASYPWCGPGKVIAQKLHPIGTSDAATLLQGGRKFRHMDTEPGHGTWPVSRVWDASLGLFYLVVQMKSTSYAT